MAVLDQLLAGQVGTGRSSRMRQLMQAHARSQPVPPDLCYLHHVEQPERPLALRLPAGQGRHLRQRMQQLARCLQAQVPRRLGEGDVKAESERITQAYQSEESRAYAELHAFAQAHGFSLMREQGHLVFTCRDENGNPLTAEHAMAMSPLARERIDQDEARLRERIGDFLDKTRALEHVMNEGLAALRRQIILPLLQREWQEVRQTVQPEPAEQPVFETWLQSLQDQVLAHGGGEEEALRLEALQDVLHGLRVNVAVDNHGLLGAPVVLEDNPSHRQLFGCVEYAAEGDMLLTDFTRIRAGSLLRAHGGCLLLHLRDVLADSSVWERLRRYVRRGWLQIEDAAALPVATVSLTPQAVRAQVKLVLVASPDDDEAMELLDPDVARRFRCKVVLSDSFLASPQTWRETAVFVAHTCARWGLPHCTAEAVALLPAVVHPAWPAQGSPR